VSVRALARKAATNLNIRWNKRTYVFEVVESDTPSPCTQSRRSSGDGNRPAAPLVTPMRLLALLDKAKAFNC